ncbi:IstB-like ATP binding protein [Malonomonas rubra DSM 5091]|uniref:IstB-like ATP binding protein n=1 Tax=Malonomonas rubra DSM 5091 TaxID=1122189 RepID=A0A1M6B982_MALRU|nr:IstB-like ATP binding protein [Malonomonas rubra DSM 5091]
MLRQQLLTALKELKLHGMRSILDEVLVNGTRQKSIPEKILLELLNAEQVERKMRSIRYRMGQAKFPVSKDLDQFDFSVSPVNETQVRTLYEGQFLVNQTNVILVGGTGTGKTHLAIAIARHIVRSGKRCRYFNLVDLGQST